MFEYSITRLFRALQRAGEIERPVVSNNRSHRSRHLDISTWVMVVGIVIGILGFAEDRRLVLLGLTLFIIGLAVALLEAMIDTVRNR